VNEENRGPGPRPGKYLREPILCEFEEIMAGNFRESLRLAKQLEEETKKAKKKAEDEGKKKQGV